MKYLLIIIMFTFSCTQIERVGNEKVYLDRDEAAEVTVEESTEETTDPVEVVTPVKKEKLEYAPDYVSQVTSDMSILDEWEGTYIKSLKPGSGDGDVVKLVQLLKPNSYGISKVWYRINVHNDGKLLDDDRTCVIGIKIQSVGKSSETYETQFNKKSEEVKGKEAIDKITAEYTSMVENKFIEILTLLIENRNE